MYKLFDTHKNQAGKGIPKFLRGPKKMPHMLEIIEGRIAASSFDPNKLKYALIEQGYLLEECAICSFKERRVLDYKMPLLLHFKDNNSNNYSLDNVQLLCYNHYFLTVGDVFNEKDVKQIETKQEHFGTSEKGNIGRATNDPDQIDLIVREGEEYGPFKTVDVSTGKKYTIQKGGKTKASFEASEAEPRAVGGPRS